MIKDNGKGKTIRAELTALQLREHLTELMDSGDLPLNARVRVIVCGNDVPVGATGIIKDDETNEVSFGIKPDERAMFIDAVRGIRRLTGKDVPPEVKQYVERIKNATS